jgi:hypothetical protein
MEFKFYTGFISCLRDYLQGGAGGHIPACSGRDTKYTGGIKVFKMLDPSDPNSDRMISVKT